MVSTSDRIHAFWTLDLCGAGAALAMLAFGLWFGFFKGDSAGNRIADIRALGAAQIADLQLLRQQIQEQELIRDGHLRAVKERGALPSDSYIDRDLATITTIAKRNDLNITDVAPQEPVHYSGVVEQRYNVHLVGKFPDYQRFMEQFEQSDCWADITSLSLRTDPSSTQSLDQQAGRLAISFFSVKRDAGSTADASIAGGRNP